MNSLAAVQIKRAEAVIAGCRALLIQEVSEDGLVKSDLSVVLKKVVAWVESLNLGELGRIGAKVVLGFAIDELIPRLVDVAPMYLDLILLQVVVPLLKKLLEALDAPATV